MKNRAWARTVAAWMLVVCAGAAAADEVDIAVDAFSIAGASVGISLNGTEKTIVKAIVRCVGQGVQGRGLDLGSCARNEIVQRLPSAARPLALCMLKGRAADVCAVDGMLAGFPAEARVVMQCVARGEPVTRCGTDEALRRLPGPARWVGECVASGRAYPACAAEAASKGLPPDAQPLARCLAGRADFGRCAKFASSSSSRQALDLVNKLKADNRTDLGDGSIASIRNMIQVADGIRENDWIKVSYYGGVEVYKAAAKIVLNVLLTPVFQPLIGPIADAVIQHRADLFARLVTALKARDEGAVAEVAIEGYLIMQIEIACALPMPDEVREAVCGTLGKIIKGVANVGGDIADLAGRLIEDPLGIPSSLWDETQRAREVVLAGKSTDCDSPPVFYAETYARCYQRGARLIMSDPQHLSVLTDSINGMCREYYDGCYFSNRFDELCNPQRDMFVRHSHQIVAGLERAAAMSARGLRGTIRQAITDAGDKACRGKATAAFVAKEVEAFTITCARNLKVQVPARGNPNSDSCGGKASLLDTPHWLACDRAVKAVSTKEVVAQACRSTWLRDARVERVDYAPRRISLALEDNPRLRNVVKPPLASASSPPPVAGALPGATPARPAPSRAGPVLKARKVPGVSTVMPQGVKKTPAVPVQRQTP
jgi:hypothetical protein